MFTFRSYPAAGGICLSAEVAFHTMSSCFCSASASKIQSFVRSGIWRFGTCPSSSLAKHHDIIVRTQLRKFGHGLLFSEALLDLNLCVTEGLTSCCNWCLSAHRTHDDDWELLWGVQFANRSPWMCNRYCTTVSVTEQCRSKPPVQRRSRSKIL